MKEDTNTTASREIDWQAEYWKGLRDYIELNQRKIESDNIIIELTKELAECREILARKRTINQYKGGTNKIS